MSKKTISLLASWRLGAFAFILCMLLQNPPLMASSEKSFVFIIPSRNNAQWYERNLDSVFSQSYQNYRVIYIDDASTDGTGTLVKEYIAKNALHPKVILLENTARQGALANIYAAAGLCSPHEIIVPLDGDDWLAHHHVLRRLNEVYQNSNVWFTHSQFIYYPSYESGFGGDILKETIESLPSRSYVGPTQLRTFYAGLFQQIKKEDLLYKGNFFDVCYDVAILFPLIEMAREHIQFIPEVSCVYNIATAFNDFKVRTEEQIFFDQWIRKKEPYAPVDSYIPGFRHKKVYITPGYWGELFSIDNPVFNRDDCLSVLYELREEAAKMGCELRQAEDLSALGDFDFLVVFDILPGQAEKLARFPKEKLLLFLWEPPSVIPENYEQNNHEIFSKVFTWRDDLVDNQKYFKFYYPVLKPMIPRPIEFAYRRLATMILANKTSSFPGELYTERRSLIDFYETSAYEDFDLFGKWWPSTYKTYQGEIHRKVDCLQRYKFCYAYENIRDIPGYVTEKMFDCFEAGTIPIYWGASNVTDYIPEGCFIDRHRFHSNEHLLDFLKKMTEEEHEQYLNNIQQFLNSDNSVLFSKKTFIKIFMNAIL